VSQEGLVVEVVVDVVVDKKKESPCERTLFLYKVIYRVKDYCVDHN
jgi:hypothetical protein